MKRKRQHQKQHQKNKQTKNLRTLEFRFFINRKRKQKFVTVDLQKNAIYKTQNIIDVLRYVFKIMKIPLCFI